VCCKHEITKYNLKTTQTQKHMGETPKPSIAALLAGLVALPTVQKSKSGIWRMDVL